MALAGKRKAALFLMNLEPGQAAELLRDAPKEVVSEIAAELAFLQESGQDIKELQKEVQGEFEREYKQSQVNRGGRFVEQMLSGLMGAEQSKEEMGRLKQMVERRDPFMTIRQSPPELIAAAIQDETPMVGSLIVSELPPDMGMQLLEHLPDELRGEVVRGVTSATNINSETRHRVAGIVRERIRELKRTGVAGTSGGESETKQLRKIAVMLRSMDLEASERILQKMSQHDESQANRIRDLMVTWEDMVAITDRTLQEVLRTVDSKKLALALVGADEETIAKVRENISERASTMLDEESELLAEPSEQEVNAGREEILAGLRALNQKGELQFIAT